MGHATTSGRQSAGAAANVREGREPTAVRSLSTEQIQSMSRNIDRQGFEKIGNGVWEMVPRDQEISSAGARITKGQSISTGEPEYELETWGTTNIQAERMNNGQETTMTSYHRTLAAAKTAAKEELKGYLSSVRYNPRTGATPGEGRGLVTSSRARTLAGNRRYR